MLLTARPLRVLGWAVVVPAALLLSVPAAFLGALQLWKREVRFGEHGFRHWYHVQGTPLAGFPVVAPEGAPRFSQRVTSGYGTYLDVTYRTRAPARAVLEQVAARCPDEPWARQAEGTVVPAGDGPGTALACGPVLFTITRAGEELAVTAFLAQ